MLLVSLRYHLLGQVLGRLGTQFLDVLRTAHEVTGAYGQLIHCLFIRLLATIHLSTDILEIENQPHKFIVKSSTLFCNFDSILVLERFNDESINVLSKIAAELEKYTKRSKIPP